MLTLKNRGQAIEDKIIVEQRAGTQPALSYLLDPEKADRHFNKQIKTWDSCTLLLPQNVLELVMQVQEKEKNRGLNEMRQSDRQKQPNSDSFQKVELRVREIQKKSPPSPLQKKNKFNDRFFFQNRNC